MTDEQSHAAGELSPVRRNGAVRPVTAALLVLCLSAPLLANTHKTAAAPQSKSETAQQQFAHAAALRQDLEGRPHSDRTRLDYGRVMDAYRAVYHGDPSSGKSADAITAVAELLAEEGRLFAERKPLEDAVGQYEFLRKQYPASPLRLKGTLVEAEILDHDLGDPATARTRLQEFLKSYPRSDLAPEARRELATMGNSSTLKIPQTALAGTRLGTPKTSGSSKPPDDISAKPVSTRTTAIGKYDSPAVSDSGNPRNLSPTPLPDPAPESQARATYADGPHSRGREPAPAVLTQISEQQTPPARSGGRIMITDIRHWSTPDYTRVAIDLGGEVRFQAGRIPNPDRIYFDLYNTRLAPQLLGHLISVQGDAFLKDIRSAQYTQEVTRVVLDVSSLSEYSAFLLPNPYRLIIDVHGRKPSSGSKPAAPTEGPGVDSEMAPATDVPSAKPSKPARTAHTKPAPLPETVLGPVDKVDKPDYDKPASPRSKTAAKKTGNAANADAETPKDNKKETDKAAESDPSNPDKPAVPPATPPAGNTDANGHETGVANPPGDVTTTPSDENQPPAVPAAPVPVAPAPSPDAGSGGGGVSSDPQNMFAHPQATGKKPTAPRATHHPSPAPKDDDPTADIATLPQQPQSVRAKKQPTTRPAFDTVVPHNDDATDTPPFAKSVVPGAMPQSAASTDSAVTKASQNAKNQTPNQPQTQPQLSPETATVNSLDTPPLPVKGKRRHGKQSPATAAKPDAQLMQVHEADPTASGERSLVRALGLKIGRIVIDPGHGGHDAGTVGPDGIAEKDVVLDVGLRLGKLLRERLGADVTFTRNTDTFVPLETRTAIANKAQADLFVSIHANSSRDPTARGVETYYLNFTSSPEALDVAARENAVSQKSIHELQDLVKKITLKDKIDESKEFAGDVERSLSQGIGQSGAARDRGVKKAPFVVLIGANMPSILTEISFVSNPDDAHELRDPAYRERLAESLYAGIARYINGLSSVRLAQASPHAAGN